MTPLETAAYDLLQSWDGSITCPPEESGRPTMVKVEHDAYNTLLQVLKEQTGQNPLYPGWMRDKWKAKGVEV